MSRLSSLLVVATGCSFAAGVHPSDSNVRDAPSDVRTADGGPTDGGPTDAKVFMDASSACIAHSTFDDPVSGHHYFLTAIKDRDGAQAECVMFEGHLVKIETMHENDLLKTFIPSAGTGYAWIGLRDQTMTDTYVWTDGTPLGGYDGFASGPPISINNCVDMKAFWAAFDCAQPNRGICECE